MPLTTVFYREASLSITANEIPIRMFSLSRHSLDDRIVFYII